VQRFAAALLTLDETALTEISADDISWSTQDTIADLGGLERIPGLRAEQTHPPLLGQAALRRDPSGRAPLVVANPTNWMLNGLVHTGQALPGVVGIEYSGVDLDAPTPLGFTGSSQHRW
jgi:hypothetical protein